RLAWQWLVEQRKLDRVDELSSIFTHHQFGRGLYAEVEAQMKSAQRQLANTDQFLLCILASMQGRSAQFLGRFEEARAIYRDALKITLKHKDPYMLGANYMWLSETERALGNYDEAKRLGEKARQKVDDPRHQWTQTFVLANLGRIAFLMGDYDEAERLLRESLAIALECGTRIGATDAWDHLGYVQLALAKRQEAQHDFESGLRVAREIGYEIGIMLALSGLAETAWRSDARAEAMAYLREAFEFVGTSHVPPDLILYAFVIMAEIVAAENQPAQAIQLLNIVRRHTASPEQTRERAETLLHKLATDSGMVADTSAELPRLEQVAKALLENELAAAGAPKSPNRASADLLNERELEILQLIADGLSNREIAARLYLALGTVKWYINQIYGKLNVTSRTQAVALARESQILP
ncbi:MAG: tetratricopeptide repeat protein, partial [Anaerolineae bacterium]|nr:tetratricopeptide repeat protein [Anaerolineae bacterium]